jgi:hypothetical protein
MSSNSPLPVEAEQVLKARPDIASWTENLLFTLYDGPNDIGMWLHLGSSPHEWALWEDRVLITLPHEGGVLTMWAYRRTPVDEIPAGANLAFKMVEPFKKWKVTFDGFALHTPHEEMRTGVVSDGPKQRVILDLDVELVTPPWDAHSGATDDTGKGSMKAQEWATDHYEQLCHATGTVTLESGTVTFDGTGWRDHSRGPRGGGVSAGWGGHVIMGAWFPGQHAGIGLSRYWAPNGDVTLEGGWLVDNDVLRHVPVAEIPLVEHLQTSGEKLRFAVGSEGDISSFEGVTTTSMWTGMSPGMPYGAGAARPALVYAINFGTCEYRGEAGYFYVERSGSVSD